jgi:hypothetical protein
VNSRESVPTAPRKPAKSVAIRQPGQRRKILVGEWNVTEEMQKLAIELAGVRVCGGKVAFDAALDAAVKRYGAQYVTEVLTLAIESVQTHKEKQK